MVSHREARRQRLQEGALAWVDQEEVPAGVDELLRLLLLLLLRLRAEQHLARRGIKPEHEVLPLLQHRQRKLHMSASAATQQTQATLNLSCSKLNACVDELQPINTNN